MGGMVLETNMNEILTRIEEQNKLEKQEVRRCSRTLRLSVMKARLPTDYHKRTHLIDFFQSSFTYRPASQPLLPERWAPSRTWTSLSKSRTSSCPTFRLLSSDPVPSPVLAICSLFQLVLVRQDLFGYVKWFDTVFILLLTVRSIK